MKLKYISVLLVLSAAVLFGGCAETRTSRDAFLLGTICSATVYGGEAQAIDKAFARVTEIENTMSLTLAESELNAVNAAPVGTAVELSDELFDMLLTATEYEELTDYSFNITLGRLSALWNINAEAPAIPDETALKQALLQTGSGAYTLDSESRTIVRNSEATLDLGAIAKGYAADEVKRVLSENGVKNAIISLGGNIIAMGTDSSRGGGPWLVGIANPRADGLIATIEVMDKFVVTSGDYERYFMLDGVRYHHIIDPQTGRPASNGIISATIIADNSAFADALSTAAFILGEERALELINSLDSVEAVLITDEMELVLSDGMGKYNLR